jgi:hypothetical protein
MLIRVLKLRHSLIPVVREAAGSVYVTTDDCQGITTSGKGLLVNEDNAIYAVINIEEVCRLNTSEHRFLISIVKELSQEQQSALHELWYDLR